MSFPTLLLGSSQIPLPSAYGLLILHWDLEFGTESQVHIPLTTM